MLFPFDALSVVEVVAAVADFPSRAAFAAFAALFLATNAGCSCRFGFTAAAAFALHSCSSPQLSHFTLAIRSPS
jgi:hypothetical protein